MENKVVLIDGHSIMNRAFYALPVLTNAEGQHTNAVYGFLNILFKILEEEKADYLAVAFDVSAPTFRHKMYEEYKGTRKGMPAELKEQIPLIKEVLTTMGITIVEKAGYEADDLLGTIAKRCEKQGMIVSIVSGDRDLLQLATDKIKIRIPKTKKSGTEIEDYNEADVVEKYQVTPLQIIELKALMGDSSDNIPGLPGVGEKTATKLIVEYKNIENAYEHVEEIKPNRAKQAFIDHFDLAKISKELATICVDCDIEFEISNAQIIDYFHQDTYQMFKRLEFKNLLSRFEENAKEHVEKLQILEINNIDEWRQVLNKAKESAHMSYTFEINQQKELYCISVAVSESELFYIKVNNQMEIVEEFDKVLLEIPKISTFDLKSNLQFISKTELLGHWDLEIASYVLNPKRDSYEYDILAKDFNGTILLGKSELIGKNKIEKAVEDDEIKEKALQYLANKVLVLYQIREKIEQELEATGMKKLYCEIELPLIYTLYNMEHAGIKVNKEDLKNYGQELQSKIQEIEKSIYQQAGEEFNINSPKQLGVILFEKLQMPHAKKTKTGYSTAADVLDKLAEEYPLVSSVLEYRQLSKLKSTYADGLANYIGEDQRIHTTFNQTIAATGRLSSVEPNLQNIPIKVELGRKIRKVFIPEENYVFLDADYSQIELRLLAHMSGDEHLIQAYNEAQDIHRITASQVFHIPFEEVTPLQRSNAKAVNFGIIYGISSFGLSQGLSISRKEAAEYIKKYFETYPNIKSFLDGLVEAAKENGFVTSLFGRRRYIPELASSNFMQRSFGERVAMNSPIQGTAADIIKIAMINVDKKLRSKNYRSRLILQVHDELLIETHKDEIDEVKELLESEMRNAAQLSVELEVETHQGDNWYEAK